MPEVALVALAQNAALLLAFAAIATVAVDAGFESRLRTRRAAAQPLRDALLGVIVGGVGMAMILTPWMPASVIVDSRSVLLGISGLFLGPFPTAIAMLMTAALRLVIGGPGAIAGVTVILASGGIGIAWRHYRRPRPDSIARRELYLFGVVITLATLALLATVPSAREELAAIALPLLLVNPLAATVLGALVVGRFRHLRIEDALRESEERLRLALGAAGMSIFDVDVPSGVVAVNDAYARMLGYDPADFHETIAAATERAHPDDRAALAAAYQDHLAGSRPEFRVEFRERTSSGDWKWILTHGRIVDRDARGAPLRILGTQLDISEDRRAQAELGAAAVEAARLLETEIRSRRALLSVIEDLKAAEEVVRASEARYRSLFESMHAGLAHCRMTWVDGRPADWTYLSVNDAFEAQTGLPDATGRRVTELVPGIAETNPELFEIYGRVAAGGPAEMVETYVAGIGEWLEISVYSPAPDEFVAMFEDITERKAAEARIRELNESLEARVRERTAKLELANAELEAFSYSVSHDLRAPLRSINGFAEILLRRHRDQLDEKGRHYLDTIVTSSGQLGTLIEELLDYARLGRASVRAEPVPLAPLVAALRSTFGGRIEASGGSLEVVEPLAVPVGDPTLIERILANLLDNALTFSRPGVAPRVTLSAASRGRTVTLAVADNGIGIAPEYRERVFEVFARLHGEDDYPGGTGIGLSIVRKAARLMDSDVTLDSVEGAGSTFSLVLPAAGVRGARA